MIYRFTRIVRPILAAALAAGAAGCHNPAAHAMLGATAQAQAAPAPAGAVLSPARPDEGPRHAQVVANPDQPNPWGLYYKVSDFNQTRFLDCDVNGGGKLTNHIAEAGWDLYTYTAPPDRDIHITKISGYVEDPWPHGSLTHYFGDAAQGSWGSGNNQKEVYNGQIYVNWCMFTGGTAIGQVATNTGADANIVTGWATNRFLKLGASFPGGIDLVLTAGQSYSFAFNPGLGAETQADANTFLGGQAVAPGSVAPGAGEAK